MFATDANTGGGTVGLNQKGGDVRTFDRRMWVRWVLTFVGFPIAGLASKSLTGPVDDVSAAVGGGAIAGVVLGAVQSLAIRSTPRARVRWMMATAAGFLLGLAVGASLVDFKTDTASLVVMGVVSGLGIGVLQSLVFGGTRTRRLVWALATPALWALGWFITSQVISDVDAQYTNFGATGAIVCTALGGAVLAFKAQQ